MRSITLKDAWELYKSDDVLLVDVREAHVFARGHLPGSLSLPYSAKGLGDRLRMLVEGITTLVLLSEDQAQGRNAAIQLHESGFPISAIVQSHSIDLDSSKVPINTLPGVSVDDLREISDVGSYEILDVREPIEWEMGYVPGATLISLGSLQGRLAELSKEGNIAVICEAGIRSSSAASILKKEGFPKVYNVLGGTAEYRNRGLTLEYPE